MDGWLDGWIFNTYLQSSSIKKSQHSFSPISDQKSNIATVNTSLSELGFFFFLSNLYLNLEKSQRARTEKGTKPPSKGTTNTTAASQRPQIFRNRPKGQQTGMRGEYTSHTWEAVRQ